MTVFYVTLNLRRTMTVRASDVPGALAEARATINSDHYGEGVVGAIHDQKTGELVWPATLADVGLDDGEDV